MFKSECPHATDTGADRTTSFCASSSTSRLQFSQTINQRLKEAASTGDIASLYSIIQEDNYILDRIDEVPFVETPLHVSTLEGRFYFSLEMMKLKPALAEKLNPQEHSPLHLAILHKQIETVLRLIKVNPYLINIQERDGLSPLHIKGYSPLHLAILHEQTETVLRLIKANPNLVNVQERDGLSPLHIASFKRAK